MWSTSFNEMVGLLFTTAAGPHQSIHSWVVQDSEFDTPPTWRARSLYLNPKEQGGQFIPQGLGSLFVASYNTKGYSGGSQTCIQEGKLQLEVML
jgi:hypothetical protein